VAVIQPGHAFGLNWTNFEAEHRIFARVVLDNTSGPPEFLLYGGKYVSGNGSSCWHRYSDHVSAVNNRLGLWRQKP
jgi:hypothetical protein